jgi:hypothetical protein
VSFEAGDPLTAYSDPVAVGDALPAAPLYLAPEWHVDAPLEASYAVSWAKLPAIIRSEVSPPG